MTLDPNTIQTLIGLGPTGVLILFLLLTAKRAQGTSPRGGDLDLGAFIDRLETRIDKMDRAHTDRFARLETKVDLLMDERKGK